MPKPPIVDLATVDFSRPEYGIEAIRKVNKQRHEMEQLTAVVRLDTANRLIVAYKDVTADEFWVRGHIPGRPLMPGVVMCEVAAQAASFLIAHTLETPPSFIGFGGLEEVRFRGPVVPGDRLVIAGHIVDLRARRATFACQGFVGTRMVFEAIVIGVPM